MMLHRLKICIAVVTFCLSNKVVAQDLHFSQFFHSPLTTNPANTGFIPDSDFRLGAHYRNQWTQVPVPYKTISVYGDAQVFRDRLETGWIGLGGVILQDKAGTGSLTSTKVYGSAAYHQMLGNTGLLSAGFNVGMSNKRIDATKLTFDNQWTGTFFDVNIPSGETFNTNNISYLDMQVGLNYAWFPTDNLYIHGGVSVHHVNRPRESFFSNSLNYDNRLSPRYIGFIDAVIKLNDQWIINPSSYLSLQANSPALMAGMHLNYNLSGDGEQQLLGGVYYRPGDAIIPMIGYQWKNFLFMFSYDATQVAKFNGVAGANELYMQFKGNYFNIGDLRQSICPSFR
ncbi:MAG: PorP/SprF family type IX secretion system membrane protein [Chitinophagaceae bacterium]